MPDAAVWLPEIHRLARELVPVAARPGAWVEDKGATLSIHYREAPDPDAAAAALEREAVPDGRERPAWSPRFGRMTLEVLPPIPVDKGSAVRRLLLHRHIATSLYAGDDTTDIDAFARRRRRGRRAVARDAARPGRGGHVRRRRHRRRDRAAPSSLA